MPQIRLLTVLALALCLGATSCGRKGDPEPPPGGRIDIPDKRR